MRIVTISIVAALLSLSAAERAPIPGRDARTEGLPAVLWQHPGSRDVYHGAGGRDRGPRGRFTFVKEDTGGTNPKFVIRDESGAEWRVKLGREAQAETAATRLLWAAGYFTDEDYVVPVLRVEGMQPLQRGNDKVDPDGSIRNARLERSYRDAEWLGSWEWDDNPFTNSREFNGLRVLMALLNNWDLKDSNTAVYRDGNQLIYLVSDAGASFGTTAYQIPSGKSNVKKYTRSKFLTDVDAESVSFSTPGRSPLWSPFIIPHFFVNLSRAHMRHIGKDVPREDAKWIGQILSRLSREQIQSAFEAAGYSPAEVETFARVVEHRISQLNEL